MLLAAALCFSTAAVSTATGVAVHHLPRTAKVVALTFDDGWSPLRVRQILAILQANHVPATFFPYARAVVAAPTTWRAVADAGYPIGNHTVSHPRLTSQSVAAIQYQICGFRAIVDPIIGRPSVDLFRPPYGRWNASVAAAAASCGYQHIVLWDVDTLDWSGLSSSKIAARALAGSSGSIVLMHAGPALTPGALQRIIDGYRARGFDFVTIPDLPALSAPEVTLPPPSPSPVYEPPPAYAPRTFEWRD